jgi:hypothetical protein
VSVIDKNQKLQIHRASAPLVAEDWNLLLEKHRAGLYVPPPPVVVSGPIVSGTIRPLVGTYQAGPQLASPFVMQSAANCFT